MGRCTLVVMSEPVEGREDEFNAWYTNRHLQDVVAVPGFRSAERFKLRSLTLGAFKSRYLAIYDIEAEDPEAAVERLMALQGSEVLPISPAIDLAVTHVAIFEACSAKVAATSLPLRSL